MKERWEFDSIIFIVVGVNMELIKVIFRGFWTNLDFSDIFGDLKHVK